VHLRLIAPPFRASAPSESVFQIHLDRLGEPAWQTPAGSLWRTDGQVIGLPVGPWVVRRLEGRRSALEVFAVLGRAATAASLAMRPAMAWKKDQNSYWTATPAPDGLPLAQGPHITSPIERWLELAEGVAGLHSKGVVHGDITPWSVWVTPDRLVLTDAGAWAAGPSDQPERHADIQGLADLLGQLTANDAAHGMASIIDEVTSGRVKDVGTLVRLVRSAYSIDVSVDGTMRVIAIEHPTNARFGQGLKFRLVASASAPKAEGAFFWEGAHGAVYDCLKGIWEGAELGLHDAHVVTDSEGRNYLTARPDTLPVVEPHWFTSVTDVIKAEGCVSRYFVDIRDEGSPGKPLVMGNILHGLLEDLMSADGKTFDELWDERVRRAGFTLIASGLGDSEVDSLRHESEAHFRNLEGFAAGQDRADRYSWSGQSVEVSRYSNRFGIEGRIDLVTEDEKRGLNIIELKTGSTREEHTSQVRAYKLLWDAYAKRQHTKVSGYLLYSREGTVRNVDFDEPKSYQNMLRGRNQLVITHHALATDPSTDVLPYYNQVPALCRAPECRWRRKTCESQCSVLGLGQTQHLFGNEELSSRARGWWRHFHHLIQAEHWSENAGFGDSFRIAELDRRIANGRCVAGLSLAGPPEDGILRLAAARLPTLSAGAQVIAHRGDPSDSHLFRGTVISCDGKTLVLRVPSIRNGAGIPEKEWFIELVPSRMGFRAAQQNLYRTLSSGRRDLLELLCGLKVPMLKAEPRELKGLNPRQVEAVSAAMDSTDACLIEGPPGTGKTTVIARAVKELAGSKRILVCAQTNNALDTVLEKLVNEGVPFLRVGASHRCENLSRALERAGVPLNEAFSDDLARSTPSVDALTKILLNTSVIACTVYSVSSNDVLRSLERHCGAVPFDVVIVDEATQLTEPLAVGALVRAKRFVLVGDPKQLPPVVTGDFEQAEHDINPMGLNGLDQSLFERLLALGIPSVRLEEQYRMNSAVMSFSNRTFYGGELRAETATASSRLAIDLSQATDRVKDVLSPATPVVFIDVKSAELGRTNPIEASVIAELANALLAGGLTREEIGVISPFRAQVDLMRQLSADLVDCDTVERFQGGEREVILVSLVRTERTGAFITDERRLNVALTRARTKVVVVGNGDCLRVSPLLRDLIEQAETTTYRWDLNV